MNKTTVIIVNWNGEKYLDSLLGWFDVNYEDSPCDVLVIDNHSTDSSRGIMGSHSCMGFGLNANWGFAQGNNIGASMVSTENILFLNNDMLPKKGFLKAMETASDSFPIVGAKLIFGETKNIEIAGMQLSMSKDLVQHAGIGINEWKQPYEMGRNVDPTAPEVNQPKEVSGVTGAALMIKTEVFTKLRGFNTQFINGFEDVDLCWRARELGYKSFYQPTAEIIHFCSSTQGRFDNEEKNRALLLSLWPPERVEKIRL